jgi:hypothetical protein
MKVKYKNNTGKKLLVHEEVTGAVRRRFLWAKPGEEIELSVPSEDYAIPMGLTLAQAPAQVAPVPKVELLVPKVPAKPKRAK